MSSSHRQELLRANGFPEGEQGESFLNKLEKLLMTSVTERYALLYSLGFPEARIKRMEMNGSPVDLAKDILEEVGNYYGREKVSPEKAEMLQKILNVVGSSPLPPGIPDAESRR